MCLCLFPRGEDHSLPQPLPKLLLAIIISDLPISAVMPQSPDHSSTHPRPSSAQQLVLDFGDAAGGYDMPHLQVAKADRECYSTTGQLLSVCLLAFIHLTRRLS